MGEVRGPEGGGFLSNLGNLFNKLTGGAFGHIFTQKPSAPEEVPLLPEEPARKGWESARHTVTNFISLIGTKAQKAAETVSKVVGDFFREEVPTAFQKVTYIALSTLAEAIDEPSLHLQQVGAPDDGEEIGEEWEGGIKENIKRIKTLLQLLENTRAQLAHAPDDERLKRRIASLEKRVKEWITSDSFRDDLRGVQGIRSDQNTDFLSRIKAWEDEMQGYYDLAAPVNMRYHTSEVDEKTAGWLRLGVISDKSNGFLDLERLKNLQKLGGDDFRAELNKMAQEIIDLWAKARAKENTNVDASAGYALRQLGFDDAMLVGIHQRLEKKEKVVFSLPPHIDVQSIKDKLQPTIDLREDILKQQFLQVVQEQLKHGKIENSMLKLLHVGLLNHHSQKIDKTGWYHNEEGEMRDMAAIFDQFDGKKIIFGKEGPYFDKEGNIHLPTPSGHPEGEITLRALYINQSVQGYTKNDGTQAALNKRAWVKMLKLRGCEPIAEILRKAESSYSTAADVIDLARQAGFCVSTGCESAKDRTGYVSAEVAINRHAKHVAESIRRSIMMRQLEEDSPAVRVVRDNTGTKILKVVPFVLEGITDKFDVKGIAFRIKMYAKQFFEIQKEKARIRAKLAAGKAAPPPPVTAPPPPSPLQAAP